jgi:6-phosphogluconolactonase
VDPAGTAAVVSNYGGGSVASFPLGPDGRLGPVATLIQHEGSSVDPERQESPHAHSTNFDAAGRFAVTADLGLDQLRIYELDPATSRLTAHAPPFTPTHPGAGPRHFAFHPSKPVAYAINELDATLTTLGWDAEAGRLESLQTIGTLPPGFGGRRSTAEVVVHPGGRFVYGSNRGHDSLAIFAVDPREGTLKPVGHVPSGGAEPRNFNLDPTGRWLIACNQNSHDVQVFAVDGEAGGLTPVGKPVSVPMPVCVRFLAEAY